MQKTKRAQAFADRAFVMSIIRLAKVNGWRVMSNWKREEEDGDPGFPSLTLIRDKVLFANLTHENGAMEDAQIEWMMDIQRAGGECLVWTPVDIPIIEETLQRERAFVSKSGRTTRRDHSDIQAGGIGQPGEYAA